MKCRECPAREEVPAGEWIVKCVPFRCRILQPGASFPPEVFRGGYYGCHRSAAFIRARLAALKPTDGDDYDGIPDEPASEFLDWGDDDPVPEVWGDES